MRKEFRVDIRFEKAAVAQQRLLMLHFDEPAITVWSIAICMLKARVIDEAVFLGAGSPRKLELSLLRRPQTGQRATSSSAKDATTLAISETELDYWIDFFLKYLRDGYAAVDHLDLETQGDGGPNETLDLVLRVPIAATAVSPLEARRRLGL